MAGYFSQPIEAAATHSDMLNRSLAALRLEVPTAVAYHHEIIVRAEIDRLALALSRIAQGIECPTKEDMQRIAKAAIPELYQFE